MSAPRVVSLEHAKNGTPVVGLCILCGRAPRPDEKYGSDPAGWDFTNICPESWADLFKEGD